MMVFAQASNSIFQQQVQAQQREADLNACRDKVQQLQGELITLIQGASRSNTYGKLPEEGLEMRRLELDRQLTAKVKELLQLERQQQQQQATQPQDVGQVRRDWDLAGLNTLGAQARQ